MDLSTVIIGCYHDQIHSTQGRSNELYLLSVIRDNDNCQCHNLFVYYG